MKKQISLFALSIAFVFNIYSQVINVPADYPTIQAAIDTANNLDTILVAPGTYVENINFNGKNITLASHFLTTQDTSYISQTIIDGNENGAVVKFTSGEESTALLSGLTIINGTSSGIYCWSSAPKLQNLFLTNNSGNKAGGIYCRSADPVIMNTTISGNNSTYAAGGIYIEDNSSVIIDNSKIVDNNGQFGGGVQIRGYFSSSVVNIINCDVSYNSSMYGGGFCDGANSHLTIQATSITNNTSTYQGGGIRTQSGSIINMDSVTISYNQASYGGGLYSTNSTQPFLKNVSITHNIATERGGGIHWGYNGGPIFHDSDRSNIYLNEAPIGADLYGYSSDPVNIVVDTFSVLQPNAVFVYPLYAYSFDILHGKIEQVEADLYVSPDGDNSNDGLTPKTPIKNIDFGFLKVYTDSLNPKTLNLLEGTYSTANNGDIYPVCPPDYLNISGISAEKVMLDAEGQETNVLQYYYNKPARLSGITVTGGTESGIECYATDLVIENAIIRDNSGNGGGISFRSCNPLFKNVVISNNTQGGGINFFNCNPTLINTTIADNSANYEGGGIFARGEYYYNTSYQVDLTNCVLWNNSPAQAVFHTYDWWGTSAINISYSNIMGGDTGIICNDTTVLHWLEGNIDADPLFSGSSSYFYALSDDSPCIDVGTPDTTGLELPLNDLSGGPRIWNDRVDMGAYEWNNIAIDETIPISSPCSLIVYPNPCISQATIEYDIKKTSSMSINIYNHFGKHIRTLARKVYKRGHHKIIFDVNSLKSGIYFCKMISDTGTQTTKIIKL